MAPPPSIAEFDPEGTCRRGWILFPFPRGWSLRSTRSTATIFLSASIAEAGGEYSIHGEVTSPFDYFLNLFGFSGGFLALAEEPERVEGRPGAIRGGRPRRSLSNRPRRSTRSRYHRRMPGPDSSRPGYYREFVLPFERQIAAAVRTVGVPVYLHTCGAIRDRLEMMAEAAVSGIECLDPPPLGNVELEEAKARVGRTIFIKGNIDPVHTLLFGSPEKVETDVRRRLGAGMPGGGFILSTACSIAPHTPAGHIEMLAPPGRRARAIRRPGLN